jgi:uncharacterized pyridoxamine 5'-phosphate oxidase family protein
MTELQKLVEFFNKCGTYYLATVDGDKPAIRPIGACAIFEDKLYLVTSKFKPMYRQMAANPRIAICACDNGRQWLRLSARAITDDRLAAKQAMLAANPMLTMHYKEGANDPNIAVLSLEDVAVEWY